MNYCAQVSRRRDDNARRGVARIEAVAQFADGRAESPKESESRVVIAELGFAAPELQYEVFDADGLAGRADFAWPSERTLGEYDGKTKYFDEQLTGGLSPEQILWKEKRREERLRAAASESCDGTPRIWRLHHVSPPSCGVRAFRAHDPASATHTGERYRTVIRGRHRE